MTTEELLRPRYKVIDTWPGMHLEPFRLHQVVTLQPHKEEDAEGFIYIPYKHKPKNFMWESFFTLFPHLFKKLEWWEDRKPEEMPEYVKEINSLIKIGEVIKVKEWHMDDEETDVPCFMDEKDNHFTWVRGFKPTTAAEYEQYISQHKQQ